MESLGIILFLEYFPIKGIWKQITLLERSTGGMLGMLYEEESLYVMNNIKYINLGPNVFREDF